MFPLLSLLFPETSPGHVLAFRAHVSFASSGPSFSNFPRFHGPRSLEEYWPAVLQEVPQSGFV